MSDKVTLSADDLQAMIAAAVATALTANKTAKKAKGGRKPLTDEEKAKNRAKTEAETIKNFKAAGYKDVRPRENVMTYLKWVQNGRMVRKGEKNIKCGAFALFHVDQTDPIKAEGTVH